MAAEYNFQGILNALEFTLGEHLPLADKDDERRLLEVLNSLFDGEVAPKAEFVAFCDAGGTWVATVAATADLPQKDLPEWCAKLQESLEDLIIIEPCKPRAKLYKLHK